MQRQGQVTFEYFLLFGVVAVVTIIGLTSFDKQVQKSVEQDFGRMAEHISGYKK